MERGRFIKRPGQRSEEGAVMLVVMLILLTSTAMAAVALQGTQYELRAAGYSRAATQTQYVSEAAAATTLAWVDATSMDRSFLKHVAAWNAAIDTPPNLHMFGEPKLTTANRQNASRTQWRQQRLLEQVGMAPISRPGTKDADGAVTDLVGTFGPRSGHVPGVFNELEPLSTDYVVDLYDCRQLPNTGTAGSQVNQGGSGTLRQFQYYCVVTARGGAFVPGAPQKTWTLQGANYAVRRLTMGHDARGTIVTPPIIQ